MQGVTYVVFKNGTKGLDEEIPAYAGESREECRIRISLFYRLSQALVYWFLSSIKEPTIPSSTAHSSPLSTIFPPPIARLCTLTPVSVSRLAIAH